MKVGRGLQASRLFSAGHFLAREPCVWHPWYMPAQFDTDKFAVGVVVVYILPILENLWI